MRLELCSQVGFLKFIKERFMGTMCVHPGVLWGGVGWGGVVWGGVGWWFHIGASSQSGVSQATLYLSFLFTKQ